MEWPAHQLLRQQCDPRTVDVEVGSSCSTGSKCVKICCSRSSSITESTCGVASPKHLSVGGAEPPAPKHTRGAPHRQKQWHTWQRRCRSYSRLDGWYVLAAEILGTIILIALCVVAANQVGSCSGLRCAATNYSLIQATPAPHTTGTSMPVNLSASNKSDAVLHGVVHLVLHLGMAACIRHIMATIN